MSAHNGNGKHRRNGKKPKKRSPKKPAGKPGEKPGNHELVTQPHGGAIYQGPAANVVPGPGRPPAAIRATARLAFDRRLTTLEAIADKPKAKDADIIRAIDTLGKYGMSDPVSIDDVRDCWRQQIEEIRDFLPPEQSEPLLARLRPIWNRF